MPVSPYKRVKKGVLVDDAQPTLAVASVRAALEPVRPKREELERLVDKAISPDDWVLLFRKAFQMSMGGEVKAMEFLAKYRWGLPAQMIAHSGLPQTNIAIVEVVRQRGAPLVADSDIEAADAGVIEGVVLSDVENVTESVTNSTPDNIPDVPD